MGIQLDDRCKWVELDQPEGAVWRLVQFAYQDETQSRGDHKCYVTVLDENGAPMSGKVVWQKWPDALPNETQEITKGGDCHFGLYGGPFYPDRGERGAYWFFVGDPGESDIVSGLGLPVNRHVCYFLTFQKKFDIVPTPNPSTNEQLIKQLINEALERAKFR